MAKEHEGEVRSLRIVTLTISDTRTESDDEGGKTLQRLLASAGFVIERHERVHDEIEAIQAAVRRAVSEGAHAVVSTGGTGIARRDVTYEAVKPLLEKELEGFGEAFRRLSWEQVGARSILSRALAGTIDRTFVVALPGSVKALGLAVDALVVPVLPHTAALLAR